ncbi:MAG: hypothetical protein ACOCY8_02045 [Spirochaetota bacterium]
MPEQEPALFLVDAVVGRESLSRAFLRARVEPGFLAKRQEPLAGEIVLLRPQSSQLAGGARRIGHFAEHVREDTEGQVVLRFAPCEQRRHGPRVDMGIFVAGYLEHATTMPGRGRGDKSARMVRAARVPNVGDVYPVDLTSTFVVGVEQAVVVFAVSPTVTVVAREPLVARTVRAARCSLAPRRLHACLVGARDWKPPNRLLG